MSFFVDQFPMTGSGKIQKYLLREMALELCKKTVSKFSDFHFSTDLFFNVLNVFMSGHN